MFVSPSGTKCSFSSYFRLKDVLSARSISVLSQLCLSSQLSLVCCKIAKVFIDVYFQVPSSQFVFGANQSGGAPDLIVTSSNSGLQGQEGLDRTAMDIQVRIRNIRKENIQPFVVITGVCPRR